MKIISMLWFILQELQQKAAANFISFLFGLWSNRNADY
jgi:hypothetical protein